MICLHRAIESRLARLIGKCADMNMTYVTECSPPSSRRDDDLIASIPLLRQFCFGMTGCQKSADDVIELFLRKFEAEESTLNGTTCTLGLFKAFLDDRRVRDAFSHSANDAAPVDALHAEVIALPVELRQAALLVVTTGFTHEEAADILGTSADDVGGRVSAAIDQLFSCRTRQANPAQQETGDGTQGTIPVAVPA